MRALAVVSAVAACTALSAQSSLSEATTRAPVPRLEERRAEAVAAADRGLAFLARTQAEGGYWTGHVGHKRMDSYMLFCTEEEQRRLRQGHMGVTSLAGLAFLAGGHLPDRGPHGVRVRKTLDYVLAGVSENGFIADSGTRMYSHAFATLFLAQIYGMVGEARIKRGLERAVHWIVDCQNKQGAWRYNGFTPEADLSVTVCQLQALRAARNIGIAVPQRTIERAVDYVTRSRTESGRSKGLYYYKIRGRGAYEKNRRYAINAAAVTSLFSAGVYDKELVEPPLAFLEQSYPSLAMSYRNHFYYWYGNYYACQAFFQAGGEAFAAYYRQICTDLLEDQRADGRWVNDVGPGDAFSSAVACMILQIPRQYLPIFQR